MRAVRMYASSDRAGSTLTALLEMCTDQFRFSRLEKFKA